MKTVRTLLLIAVVLTFQGLVWGQTITYNGNVPPTFSILNESNTTLLATDDVIFKNAIGSGTVKETSQNIRLRSNAGYKLSARVTTNTNIADGVGTTSESTTAADIKLGDICFGVDTVTQTGLSVVKGGATPTRTDTKALGFTYGSPSATDGRRGACVDATQTPGVGKSLHDIKSAAVQILSGERISANGDNTADDNFLTVALKAGYLPQYFTPTEDGFTVVVTLTIAASGGE